MTPCSLNALIAAICNYLYCSLTREQFKCLSIFLNELSKSMFATTLFEDICTTPEPKKPPGGGKHRAIPRLL